MEKEDITNESVSDLDSLISLDPEFAKKMEYGPMPKFAEKFLGVFNILKIKDFLNREILKDIEVLFALGDIDKAKVEEYMMSLPEYISIKKELIDLAESIAKTMMSKKTFAQALASSASNPKASSKSINNSFNGIVQILDSQIVDTDKPSFINGLISLFQASIFQKYFFKEFQYFNKLCFNLDNDNLKFNFDHASTLNEVIKVLKRLEISISKRTLSSGLDDRLNSLMLAISQVTTFQKEAYVDPVFFKKIFDTIFKYSEEIDDLDLPNLLEVIQERSMTKFPEPTRMPIDDGSFLEIFNPDVGPYENFHLQNIATLRLSLSSNVQQEPITVLRKNDGTPGEYQYNPDNSSLVFSVDRQTGDLCFPLSSICLKDFLGEKKYKILKKISYNLVFDQLIDSKTIFPEAEDLENHIIEAYQKIEDQQSLIRNLLIEEELIEEKSLEKVETENYLVELEEGKPVNRFDKRQVKGLRARTVIKTLGKIFGKPRITGSHHIFTNEDGVSYPFPFHTKGIAIPIVLKGLKILGCSLDNFLGEAL